ncbi:uncharacterized protein LOC142827426 [Pelodiscus sinensis]|uniref:uncharacterized protein LOC142827426 n=1 Tax=Pelodiscus sinensis TaxID=13735 RepID=UPI003F6CF2D2
MAVYSRMADSLAARGHQRSRDQVRCKIKDLQQSYSRACQPGAYLEACPHFEALDCILGAHAVHVPWVVIDPGAEGPVPDTEEEEQEDAESQEPAGSLPRTQDPRGTPQHNACVVRGRGGLHIRSTWDCRAHHPACNSHPHPGQQACQERGGVPAAAPAVPGSPAPHPGPLGPGGPSAAPAELGGAGGAGPCPQRPRPDPSGQVPASSCSSSCGCPSSRSSSHPCSCCPSSSCPCCPCSPSRFLRTPHPSCPTLHTHSSPTPPHLQCCKMGEPAGPPSLSFPFPSSPSSSLLPGFPLPSPTLIPPSPPSHLFRKRG